MGMMIEIIIDIALTLIAYAFGYYIGYRHCFEYLRAELKKAKEDEYKNDKV